MKYIVMECHKAYAVLMDESARFVNAANLNYTVGQTVTNPIIMNNTEKSERSIQMMVGKFIAVAACLALISVTGFSYYFKKFKTYSTIMISSEANICMQLNKTGEVVSLKSNNDYGEEIIKNYSIKGKDKITVANDLLMLEMSDGSISSGDTINFYISTNNSDNYNSIKSEFEEEISKLNLKVNVHELEEYKKHEKNEVILPDKHEPEKPVKNPDNAPKPDKTLPTSNKDDKNNETVKTPDKNPPTVKPAKPNNNGPQADIKDEIAPLPPTPEKTPDVHENIKDDIPLPTNNNEEIKPPHEAPVTSDEPIKHEAPHTTHKPKIK